jgi:hypothetical protein
MDQNPADSFLDTWPGHLATAAATGVTAYLPVHRWSPVARWTMHAGMGVLTGAATAYVVSRPPEPTDIDDAGDLSGVSDISDISDVASKRLGPGMAAAIGVVLTVLVAGVSRGGEAADAWMERGLARRGVRRPRAWLGAAAAGASLAMSVAESRTAARKAAEAPAPPTA